MKVLAPAVLGLALMMGASLPASASTTTTPAYNSCPLPVQEPPLLRMIGALETTVMTMLGLSTGGCSD